MADLNRLGKMKQFVQSLVRAIATFGVVAALTAVGLILLTGESGTSDDPYVLGLAVGVVVGGVLCAALVCEQLFGKKTAAWVYGAVYVLLLVYTFYIMSNSELHGPGLALLIFGVSALCAAAELFLFRRIRLVYFGSIGSALAVVVLAALVATQQ